MIVRDFLGPDYRDPDGDIGIEVEVEGSGLLDIDSPAWRSKEDGSLRGPSMEYLFTRPFPINKVSDLVEDLEFELKDATLLDSDRAGVHIHINCLNMTERQVINFVTLYYIFEQCFEPLVGEGRFHNLYCLGLEQGQGILDLLCCSKYRGSLSYDSFCDMKYGSVNLNSLWKFGSVEFRAMKTPVNDFSKIVEWAEILYRLKEFSLANSIPQIRKLALKDKLVCAVFGDDRYCNRKVRKGLKKILPLISTRWEGAVNQRTRRPSRKKRLIKNSEDRRSRSSFEEDNVFNPARYTIDWDTGTLSQVREESEHDF